MSEFPSPARNEEDPPVDPPVKDQPKTGLSVPALGSEPAERSFSLRRGVDRFTFDIRVSVSSD